MICDKQTSSELYCSMECLEKDLGYLGKSHDAFTSYEEKKDIWKQRFNQASFQPSSYNHRHDMTIPLPQRLGGLSFEEELRRERQRERARRQAHYTTSSTISIQ
jgi:hypothetical protein